ncbi:MAG: radical SAM protein [archaeon]
MTWDRNFRDRYILIEPTDHCNLDCIMCTRGLLGVENPHNQPKGFMSLDVFKKIIGDLEIGEEPMAIKLFWLGESLLHKDLPAMLEYAYSKIRETPAYLDLHTNALLLDDRMIGLLLKLGDKMGHLTVSLDAVNPDTYSRIRRNGNLKAAMDNVKNLISRREAGHYLYPAVILQLIVMEENMDEVKAFVDHWSSFLEKTLRKNLLEGFEDLDEKRQVEVLKERGIYGEFKNA